MFKKKINDKINESLHNHYVRTTTQARTNNALTKKQKKSPHDVETLDK